MAAPRKHPDGKRERATELVLGAKADPATRTGAAQRIGYQLGINVETLRGWVNQAEIDVGARPGTSSSDAQRLLALERESKELRRTNAMADSASAFFASMSSWARSTATAMTVDYLDAHRDQFAGGADLQRAAGRPEHLLRGEGPSAVGAVGHRHHDDRGDSEGPRGELPRPRGPEGPRRAVPRRPPGARPPGRPLHGGAAHAAIPRATRVSRRTAPRSPTPSRSRPTQHWSRRCPQ